MFIYKHLSSLKACVCVFLPVACWNQTLETKNLLPQPFRSQTSRHRTLQSRRLTH